MATPRRRVLFVCTHNSARSQMAEGWLRDLYGDYYKSESAGTERTEVRPLAVKVMKEVGVDLGTHYSKTVDEVDTRSFDIVVTVCDDAQEACPYIPARDKNIHRSFTDPSRAKGSKEERREIFRQVRDEIRDWIKEAFAPDRNHFVAESS